jgi:xanthine dehydrogenase accessory factor
MVVTRNRDVAGSVGGGELEARVLEEAGKMFPSSSAKLIDLEIDDSPTVDARPRDGRMVVLLESLRASPQIMRLHRELAENVGDKRFSISVYIGRSSRMARAIARIVSGYEEGVRFLERSGFPEARGWLHRVMDEAAASDGPILVSLEGEQPWRFLIEPLPRLRSLYIFGAGRVGSETARLAANAGFETFLVEDRPEFKEQRLYPEIRVKEVPDLGAAVNELDINGNSFVVIAAGESERNRSVLEAALATEAGYIGLTGGPEKCKMTCEALEERGIDKSKLSKVRCPVGIDIGAETPAEIAISIVAELISKDKRRPVT